MNPSRTASLTAGFALILVCLIGWNSAASGALISAYTYSTGGAFGIPALAGNVPVVIDNVYLPAIDIDKHGKVYVKNGTQSRFYPYFWKTTPKPFFTANVNVSANLDWTAYNPTSDLIQQLGQNNWKQDFNGDLHIDAEFTMDVKTMPSNWVDCMTKLRTYANQQGRNFTLYYNPKYLSVSTEYTAADVKANAATIKSILAPAVSGVTNHVLFPVYADSHVNAHPKTLKDAALNAAQNQFGYEWIHDITETSANFDEGMQSAHAANLAAKYTPSGVSVYQYTDVDTVTQSMKDNLAKLAKNPNSIPEPASFFIWGMGTVLLGFRRKCRC